MALTRQQVESLCLGCDNCDGLRIKGTLIYRYSNNDIEYLTYDSFNISTEIYSYAHMTTLKKIQNIEELRTYLSVNYPHLIK